MDSNVMKEILEILINRVLNYENCGGNFGDECVECYNYYDCNLAKELIEKLHKA